jgi:hypothetical protein
LKNEFAHDGIFKSKLQIKDIHYVQFIKTTLKEQGIIQDATNEEKKQYTSTLPKGHINVKNIFKLTPLARSFFFMIGEDIIENLLPNHIITTISDWIVESENTKVQLQIQNGFSGASDTSTTRNINNKPLTMEKKPWKAYCILEEIAKKREYRSIGLEGAVDILRLQLGLSDNVARKTLKVLSKKPYKYINVENKQINVIPLKKLQNQLENQ